MVVTYYIKLFHTGADRHNGILMSLLLLVAETIIKSIYLFSGITMQLKLLHKIKMCYITDVSPPSSHRDNNKINLFILGNNYTIKIAA